MSAHERHLASHKPAAVLQEEKPLWTVLVVDNNPAVRKLICEIFTREADFRVCAEAENGRDALLKAQELEPDLIITDLSMPHMNGLEEIRALRKLMLTIPVILYSAHIDSFVEKEAFAAGASAVVPKTDVVATLIPTARTLLERLAA
ncbi:MAG: response regulator [Acidobacteriia bacterium]|nr:response regulator [Terriglobia bacterium]